MNRILLFVLLLFITSASNLLYAEAPKIIFEENKNQWPQQVKFQADIPGGKLFLEQNAFTYFYQEDIDLHHSNPARELKIKSHCYKVHFKNSNPKTRVEGANRYAWHRNYYRGNDPKKWSDKVPLYSKIFYKELYNRIDLQVYNQENNLKYDLIIYPGGNPQLIELDYEGTDGIYIENGHLFIKTSIYNIIEQKPYAYQLIDGRQKEISCSYVVVQNDLKFALGKYDKSLPLIIDPTLIASTYSGSTADNWGFCTTFDNSGNMYMAGIAAGTGYPTTVGAHDVTYNGGTYNSTNSWPADISITKFNATGTSVLFSTYYGGITNELPLSLIVNSNEELFVLGRTNSTNFPTTGAAYDQSHNGGYDIIIGKFNTSGSLLASTFIGGTGDDGVNVSNDWNIYATTKFTYGDDGKGEIQLDNNGNIFVASCTKSTDFPATTAAADIALNGTQDAVVLSLTSNLSSLSWSTYLGGSGVDMAFGLTLDNGNNVYVTGGTASNDFPTTAGALNPGFQGGITDGFITKINSTGMSFIYSTYVGTSAYDQSFFIDSDSNNDVYVFGQTQGPYPVSAGVYSNTDGGHFIHKISSDLSTSLYSTVLGSGANAVNLALTAFRIDNNQNIYIAGWGRYSGLSASMPSPSSTTGLPVTANAIQSTTDGKDFYIASLSANAQALTYATFFGEGSSAADGDHLDGTSRFDEYGILYHGACASCGGTQGFPTTPGCFSSTNNSDHINYPLPSSPPTTVANCNMAIFKINVGPGSPAVASASGNPTSGCIDLPVNFNSAGSSVGSYIWDFGDGNSSTLSNPSHTYTVSGTYTASLIVTTIIGNKDTAHITITAASGINVGFNQTICAGDSILLQGNYQTTAGTYKDTLLSSMGCDSIITTSLSISNTPTITIATQIPAGCNYSNGSISINTNGGTSPYSYAWSPTGGSSTVATGLSTGGYSVIVTDSGGCTSFKTVTLEDSCDYVWPGDANDDGIANNLDILTIGISYGSTGPLRMGATFNWMGQPCSDWTDTLAGNINYKHTDCDGNGIVEFTDTLGVIQNYGLTHNNKIANPISNASTKIYPEYNVDTICSGNCLVTVNVNLGSATSPATNVHGVAYSVSFSDTSLIDLSSLTFKAINSWLGTSGVNSMSIGFTNERDGAVSRIDQQNASGYGPIHQLQFRTSNSLNGTGGNATLIVDITNATVISANEVIIPVNELSDSIVIIDTFLTTTVTEIKAEEILLSPNPTTGFLTISSTENISAVVLRDVLGQKTKHESKTVSPRSRTLNLQNAPTGIYFIELQTNRGTVTKKIIKQ